MGRLCARRALRELGYKPTAILSGGSRAPCWPSGICGSITHCEPYYAAAVGRTAEVRSIGIDAEKRQSLPEGVVRRIATEAERRWVERASDSIPWHVLFFSAKESVFKAWFPVVGTWLGFHDVHVDFSPATGSYRAEIRSSAPADHACAPKHVNGRYLFDRCRVVTSAIIPTTPGRSRPWESEFYGLA